MFGKNMDLQSNNKNHRILLINPPFYRLKNIKNPHFPLGLGYVASMLSARGYDSVIYNAEITKEDFLSPEKAEDIIKAHSTFIKSINDKNNFVWREVRELVNDFKPNIIGITVLSTQAKAAKIITQIAKERDSKCVVVWGGLHPSIFAYDILKKKECDYVIRGEGEETFSDLCDVLFKNRGSLSEINGLSYTEKDRIVHNPDRSLIQHLDQLPHPNRINLKDRELMPKNTLGEIIGSRGCPYDCSFCSAPEFWQRKVRFRSPEAIIEEIEEIIHEFGTKEFYFWDDSFTINKNFIYKLCDLLISKAIHIAWSCRTRVDLLDDKLVFIMKKAGCVKFDIGIESGSPRILKYMSKDTSVAEVFKASKILKRHGMLWSAFFMIGIPEERKEDIQMTIALMKKLKPPVIYGSIYTPLPGTRIFQDLVESKMIDENNYEFERYSSYSHENFFLKYISKEEFNQYKSQFFRLIDQNNNSKIAFLNRVLKRWKFWAYNPKIFAEKVLSRICK